MKTKFLFKILLFIGLVIPVLAHSQSKLKAVLIVGRQEDGTQNAMDNMDKIASVLTQNGVIVHKFYNDNADWDEIVKVSQDCNFFLYSGHGSTMGKNGNVGGLCINSYVTTSDIIQKLKLKPNALVIFQSVCNGAGSSASDDNDIGVNEAVKRVYNYSYPFFDVGAAGYFATNSVGGAAEFLKAFFKGSSLSEAYKKSNEIWSNIETEVPVPNYPNKIIGIKSSPGGGTCTRTSYTNGVKKVETFIAPKSYDVAMSGNPNLTVKDMR